MNENGKHEQDQPVTMWPYYAHLVLAFSILFAIAVLLVGFLGLWKAMDAAGPLQSLLSWCSQCPKAIVVTLGLGLAFFAGAFVFLALKTKTEQGEAAGRAVVWVCRILFYPVHVVFRFLTLLSTLLLLPLSVVLAGFLAYCLYGFLEPWLEGHLTSSLNAILGTGVIVLLVKHLPEHIIPLVISSIKRFATTIQQEMDLPLFPDMVMKSSLIETITTLNKMKTAFLRFYVGLVYLLVFAVIVAVIFSSFDAALPSKEEATSPPVQEKSSYVFLGNMPWIVGNVQSFFSSAVVFPRDATPEDLMGDGEDALKLKEHDKQFYRPVYKPLLADLARCGTPEKKVTIELSGFASTSDISSVNQQDEKIRGKCSDINKRLSQPKDSEKPPNINDVFNLCVSEQRAKFVKDMLEDFVEEKSQGIFEFQVKQWDSLEQMRKQTNKIFCDAPGHTSVGSGQDDKKSCRDNGQYDATRGMMNRRVDVAITETPLCMM